MRELTPEEKHQREYERSLFDYGYSKGRIFGQTTGFIIGLSSSIILLLMSIYL